MLVCALAVSLAGSGRQLPEESCDVLVVGGGTAGIAAAGQAGRAGARTILVERGFQVGGNATTGAVDYPGLFHAWGEQVIAGFGWEVVSNSMVLAGCRFPDVGAWRTKRHSQIQHPINIPLFVAVAEEMLAGLAMANHYRVLAAAAPLEKDRAAYTALLETLAGLLANPTLREIYNLPVQSAARCRARIAPLLQMCERNAYLPLVTALLTSRCRR